MHGALASQAMGNGERMQFEGWRWRCRGQSRHRRHRRHRPQTDIRANRSLPKHTKAVSAQLQARVPRDVRRPRALTGGELDAEPDAEGHDAVVDHVQSGHVLVLLAQNEEELQQGINELSCKVQAPCPGSSTGRRAREPRALPEPPNLTLTAAAWSAAGPLPAPKPVLVTGHLNNSPVTAHSISKSPPHPPKKGNHDRQNAFPRPWHTVLRKRKQKRF